MPLVPQLRKVDLKGNPTTEPDFFLEVSAGTFIKFRNLLLSGPDKQMTIFEYQCYVVLLSSHEAGRPLLHNMLWFSVYKGTELNPPVWGMPIGPLLEYITAEQFFKAVTYFMENTPKAWIIEAFEAINSVAPVSPEAEASLKNE